MSLGPKYRFLLLCLAVLYLCSSEFLSVAYTSEPSSKKGFCTVIRKESKWLEKIEALNANWFYSWGPKKPENCPEDIEFVPMLWGRYNARRDRVINDLKSQGESKSINFLMGFNEPDSPDQSNMSAAEVAGYWPRLMATGLPLASPGCVHADRQWMKDFMKEVEAKDLRVDVICVHSYGGPNAKALVDRLHKIYKLYGRPIWITEFAVGDWNAKDISENKHSPEKTAEFMRELLPMLEKLDFVHRYAWFSAATDSAPLGNSALFNKDGSLTELGKIYSSF